jgi:hypothetical protein
LIVLVSVWASLFVYVVEIVVLPVLISPSHSTKAPDPRQQSLGNPELIG